MSKPAAQPFQPSVEHKWGLLRLSRRSAWVGLTDREAAMILSLVDPGTEGDWLVWCHPWTEWKPLIECDLQFEVSVPEIPEDVPLATSANY